jgi:membrane protease YdiL (CAAX protease family)
MNNELQEDNQQKFSTKKTILVVILGIISLVSAQEVSSLAYLLPFPNGVSSVIFGALYVVISYGFIRLYCKKILHISMSDCFIRKQKIKIIWLIIAIFLPVTVSAVLLYTSGELVKNTMTTFQAINLILYSIFNVGLGAGVVEEMIFRGLIMKAVERRWGKMIAIVIPSIIFGLLHVVGIEINIINVLILIIAGTSVGIMFSLIVYESGSVWCSAIVHGTWNMIMIGGILHIGIAHEEHVIYSYKLSSNSILLTGGGFGIESSVVAILGYITVITLILFLMKRRVRILDNSQEIVIKEHN